jgi:hypothetical protein
LYVPLIAAALGVVGLLALAAAWLKGSIRTRGWFPWRTATPAEGVFGGSGLILFLAGALVVGVYAERLYTISGGEVTLLSMYGGSDKMMGGRRISMADPAMQEELKKRLKEAGIPFRVTTQGDKEFVGWSPEHNTAAQKIMESLSGTPGSSVSYSNPETQQRLKDELAKAGIPFTSSTREGREYVSWPPEHNAAADKIQENLHGPRGIHFGSAQSQKDFVNWLAKRKIKSAIVRHEGNDYVTWDDPRAPKEMMDAYIAERPSKCGPEKAKAKC